VGRGTVSLNFHNYCSVDRFIGCLNISFVRPAVSLFRAPNSCWACCALIPAESSNRMPTNALFAKSFPPLLCSLLVKPSGRGTEKDGETASSGLQKVANLD
jgi:hypothetical protein